MAIAIYSRKSKVTEAGDSIESQIKICQEYIRIHFPGAAVKIYEDEGFSGGNTDRPMFQRLLQDIGRKEVEVLVCYRLDRISRNVVDFSATLELLQQKGIDFVSIKENFDTSTPMGRAMVYISSVFAQLERETIGERIKDNLLELAKSGRYLYAIPPVGYTKKKMAITDKNGNQKYYNLLETHPVESLFIRRLFDHYLNLQSIKKLETNLLQQGDTTRNGKPYKCASIRRLLTHPIYCRADERAYRYFKELGCQIIDDASKFDGAAGIYVFRRTEGKNSGAAINSPAEWHIGAGSHEPLIDSACWIRAQQIIESRRSHSVRRPTGRHGMLSGLLKCARCGDYMRPFSIANGRFYYICATKEASKKLRCDNKNLRGDKLDAEVLEKLVAACFDLSPMNTLHGDMVQLKTEENPALKIIKEIKENKKAIQNLMDKLAFSTDPTMDQYIREHITRLDGQNKALGKQIQTLENNQGKRTENKISSQLLKDKFIKLKEGEASFLTRRNLLKDIINSMTYDGAEITIRFYQ